MKRKNLVIETKGAARARELKRFGGELVEAKQVDRNGVAVGVVKGYIATWDIDRGDDRFVKGAFAESLAEHRAKNRPLRFKDHHGRTVGGWPIDSVREDERGLYGEAEINLEVQQGREAFSLIKQGVLSDFSIGFSCVDWGIVDGVRVINKAIVWEGSIVDEPMNPKANVTEVKSVVPFQDLPLAARDRAWDADAAIERVREFTDSTDEPSAAYRRAFLWFDGEATEDFDAYKMPVADVVDGRLVAVPRAIFAAASVLEGGRGGVDIPDADRASVIRNLERYYAKMDLDSPFGEGEKEFFVVAEVKGWTERDVERFLLKTGAMSKSAAKVLAGRLQIKHNESPTNQDVKPNAELKSLLDSVRATLSTIGSGSGD